MAPSDVERALAAVPEPVTACPACASLGIRMADLRDGGVPGGGELTRWACPQCGFLGQPILFPRRESYLAFRRALA